MTRMKELLDKLCYELDEIAEKKDLGAGDLELVHKLTDTIKNIYKIDKLEDGEYSNSDGWIVRGLPDGNSYHTRNRGHIGRYSRGAGKDHLIEQLGRLMDEAETEQEREAIHRCVTALRQG